MRVKINKARRWIRRRWRHMKYWLATKLVPEEELNFLGMYDARDIELLEVTARLTKTKPIRDFLGEELIKDMLIGDMHLSLKKHIDFVEVWDGETCLSKATLTLVKRREA